MGNIAIINCFDTYEHRTDLLYNYFISLGFYVKVFESNFKHIEKVERNDIKKDYIFVKVKKYTKNLSIRRILSHFNASKIIFRELETVAKIEKIHWDLLWILLPPNSFAMQAAKYKKISMHTKIIFDVIDLWPESLPHLRNKDSFLLMMWKNLRNKNLNIADMVVTECDLYKNILGHIVNKNKIKTIYLARPIKEYIAIPNCPKNKISLCYLGSINNIIDIPAIILLIKKILTIKPVEFHIIGDGEKRKELLENAKQTGAKVIYHGKIYDEVIKQKIFDNCHYGLNIMKKDVCVGLTMKSMDYFEMGLPILNNIKGDTWNCVERLGLGVNIIDNYIKLIQTAIETDNNLNENRKAVRRFFEDTLTMEIFNDNVHNVLKQIFTNL